MNKKVIQKIALSVTILLSFVICGFLYVLSGNFASDDVGITELNKEKESETDNGYTTDHMVTSSNSYDDSNVNTIFVYVCGAVNAPDVYEVPEDSRIFEVIKIAGGASEDAYLEAINLADRVYDGQKIYVPSQDDYASGKVGMDENNANELIDINRADVNTLMTLPGIGQSRAEAIVSYRKEQGAFTCIEDIMKVSGIKDSAFNKIKDKICVR